MDGSSRQSFIPKNTERGKQRTGVRRVYVFTYISYTIFFGTLLAALGIFVYQTLLQGQLEQLKQQLTVEQNKFNDSDLLLVQEYEHRLQKAEERFNAAIPVSGIFAALGRLIADEVVFTNFALSRPATDRVEVTVTAGAEEFDALRFQREVLAGDTLTAGAFIGDVTVGGVSSPDVDEGAAAPDSQKTSFVVTFTATPGQVPFSDRNPTTPVTPVSTPAIPVESTSDAAVTSESVNN